MLNSIDHVVYLCRDIAETAEELQQLLGVQSPMNPDWLTVDDDGIWTAEFRFRGGAIELIAPAHSGADPARTCPGLLSKVESSGPGFKSLVFGTADLEGAHAQMSAAGLEPDGISSSEAQHFATGERRAWRRFRCPDRHLHGLKLFVIERAEAPHVSPEAPALTSVELSTGDPQRAHGLFAGKLGLVGSASAEPTAMRFPLGLLDLIVGQPAAQGNDEPDRIDSASLTRASGETVTFKA
jgi:hypothetical protein